MGDGYVLPQELIHPVIYLRSMDPWIFTLYFGL